MTLDQSALLELLDALKAADAGDVVRNAVDEVTAWLDAVQRARGVGGWPESRQQAVLETHVSTVQLAAR